MPMEDHKEVPGGFFKVTGAFSELVQIEQGINSCEGRETADKSMSLDLWLDMREEWHRLHRAEIENNVQRWMKLGESMTEVGQVFVNILQNLADAVNSAQTQAEQATPKGDRWNITMLHSEDCVDCEALAEDAISEAKENNTDRATVTGLRHWATATRSN